MIKVEHDTLTGEIIEIQLTDEEIAKIEAQAKIELDLKDARTSQKAALLDKLGITADEAALLLS